jgi:hypothetical protein
MVATDTLPITLMAKYEPSLQCGSLSRATQHCTEGMHDDVGA